MILRRRFADLIARQLELFEREHADLIHACEEAEGAYAHAPREEAEERYGDYLDRVEEAADVLAALSDAYASTLDEGAAGRYAADFDRAARKRFRWFRVAPLDD